MPNLTSIEICAGAGGQALGLERAGFDHLALVENEKWSCQTLRHNRPEWNVIEGDVREFSALGYSNVDLLSGGVPCPPFTVAGRQLGQDDNRDLFPDALRLTEECRPKAVMLENVRGLLAPAFSDYREQIMHRLRDLGYPNPEWRLLNASDFGVPQLRPRAILVALRSDMGEFDWPEPSQTPAPTVGEALLEQMKADGWEGADAWAAAANKIAPTLVGGSHKHGGPDLGPTRARKAWLELGVIGNTLADAPPAKDHDGLPRLTFQMAATIQGFPTDWHITGRKTAAYRQVGNAFPPPVAEAIGRQIANAIRRATIVSRPYSVPLAGLHEPDQLATAPSGRE